MEKIRVGLLDLAVRESLLQKSLSMSRIWSWFGLLKSHRIQNRHLLGSFASSCG